ncbi:TetR/AcrR family transcriptional regulator [Aeromicrobium wangtongii]|uniref:TetR/AcrR family transcriptional regulator n=1 Tax=Aeromicrobium wangtongii TaxID=2969247 RepID=A0ABY5MAD2_9ACTN|nr:TetR/AcrR family transcriptional regulator [Aeromicrobium wangtongii]MCD9199662.1 TetR/AcrR family transcriptional regulator [Aeromicrobium wangtongii]UUP14013.1 TetR/AcrR family transcriptional regulator [Aeromicrobium wangtongii]
MPTPDRTSLPAIVAAGEAILDADGLAAVTMAAVAQRVGVRPPSLYKRVSSCDELIGLIAQAAAGDLGARLAAVGPAAPRGRLEELAVVVREFARARPAAYRLVFTAGGEGVGLSRDVLRDTSAPLFEVVAELAGPAHALEAARTVTAWVTGFIAMELGGEFQLGGEIDAAFDYGIDRIADAITGGGQEPAGAPAASVAARPSSDPGTTA